VFENLSTGYLTPKERENVHRDLYVTNFKSDLKVFSDHNGFINGELHTFVGPKGGGKSTWSKTIIAELLYQEKSPLLFISEERKGKYLKNINNSIGRLFENEDKLKEMMDSMIIISELDESFENENQVIKTLKEVIKTCEMDILILDNFTTSFMSELPIARQSQCLRKFKSLADEMNIPVIMFFHTAKTADKKKLDGDSIRGSATAINIGSYNYLIKQVECENSLRNFIYTEKARYHSKANKKLYEAVYNHEIGLFVGCKDYYLEDLYQMIEGVKKPKRGFDGK
jgi:archaellum biogenesis ATPase FlaH